MGIWPIFREVVSRGDTYTFDPAISERDARLQWLMPDPAKVFVAVDAETGAVCGTSLIKPNQPRLGGHVANAAFMVSPALSRRGIGRALGNHALAWARETGYAAVQFNFVVSTNAPALALWQQLGFV
jgi:GNAT superfamily N-acetyltransferase